MIYLVLYVVIGIGTTAIFLWSNDFDLKDLLKSRDETRWKRIARTIILPLTAIIIVVSVWPVFAVTEAKEHYDERRRLAERNRTFEVHLRDLGESLSVADVEKREVVADPLGATPHLAFGHLNAAWTKFKGGITHEDHLRPFDAVWTSPTWQKERRTGYACVHRRKVTRYFFTQIVEVQAEQFP